MHHVDACACTQQCLTWGKQQALSIPDLAASRGLRASFFFIFFEEPFLGSFFVVFSRCLFPLLG